MALKVGNNAVANAYVGTTQVRRAYKGGSLVYQGFSPASEEEFIQQEATGGPAKLLKVYGKSIIWRQLIQNGDFSSGTTGWSFENATGSVQDGVCTVDVSAAYGGIRQNCSILAHKYIAIFTAYSSQAYEYGYIYNYASLMGSFNLEAGWKNYAVLCNSSADSSQIRVRFPAAGTFKITKIRFIDLTDRFGAGNEPTTEEEAERLLGNYDPSYDPGSLQSNKTSELRAERIPIINIWDEIAESGTISSTSGENLSDVNAIRSKGFIPVSPSTQYYLGWIGHDTTNNWLRQRFYDRDKNYIGYNGQITSNGIFTTPSNCYYMRFFTYGSAYGTTYNHDICINLSDPAINGTYYSHWRGSLALNLATLTGKLNGEGASVVVYPDGLRGVGTDRDAAYGSTGVVARAVVDLGTLNWSGSGSGYFQTSDLIGTIAERPTNSGVDNILCPKFYTAEGIYTQIVNGTVDNAMVVIWASSVAHGKVFIRDTSFADAAAFKAAMSGVLLDYPLATPQTYVLDTPLPTDLTCEQGDILQRVSDNNCPFVGEMKFGL